MAVRHRSLRFGVPEVAILSSLCAGAFLVAGARPAVRRTIAREEKALAAVRETAKAEHEFVARRLRDQNGDKAFEYGSLSDLEAAGLLGRPVVPGPDGAYVDVEGYRLEVLLPQGLDRATRVALSGSAGTPDPVLSARQFAVVAIPRRGAVSGLRGFYLDAENRLYEAEGVCDVVGEAHQPPPAHLLTSEEEDLGNGGPVWRPRGSGGRRPAR